MSSDQQQQQPPQRSKDAKMSMHRAPSSRKIGRTMSTRSNGTCDTTFEETEEDVKFLKFEFVRLQECVEAMNNELAKAGVLEIPEEEANKKLLKKTSIVVSSMVDKSLYKSFGWKGALAIAGAIVLLHVAFIAIYTHVVITDHCETHVQLVDSKMWNAVRSKDGHTRHVCSIEMLSMRSELFSKEDLEMLDMYNLPADTECHLHQISHGLIKEQSHRMPGFPSLHAHDFAKAEWYPCMFEGMTCDDIASMEHCGPMDLFTEACKKGWITDSNSKFKNPNAPEREAIGPYDCDTVPQVENATDSLEYKFAHFGKCHGLVSTVFNDCPDVGTTLGAAEGLAAIISALIWALIVVPFTIYWQYMYGDMNVSPGVANGMVEL